MADNVTAGGRTILADELTDSALAGGSTGLVQYMKLMNGEVDDATKVYAGVAGDSVANTHAGLMTLGAELLWNPANATWERARTPTKTVYSNTATPSAGDTTHWTPASGKKFRLMAAMINVPGNATRAAGGQVQMTLTDGASGTVILGCSCFVGTSAGTAMGADFNTGWMILPGNGYLSTAINTALMLHTGAALTAGAIALTTVGTEE